MKSNNNIKSNWKLNNVHKLITNFYVKIIFEKQVIYTTHAKISF